ncbi:Ig-like domain-containing protein, partial [bacterium]|nr:Ig-like domain-containing protein [bacterium]
FAQVTGAVDVDYVLVVGRSAVLDIESASPQVTDLTGFNGAIGFVSTLSSTSAEPDGFSAETNISNSFTGVTLSNNVGAGSIYAASASYGAPTGANVFAPGATAANGFRAGDDELRADFSVLQSTVSIDVGSDDASDVAWLRAYDASNNLLSEVVSGSVASGGKETITISRPTAEIAYVIAAGKGTDITPLDNLVYQISDPDDDLYSITASAGDQFSLDAFLPGAGVYLFHNAIDDLSGSELRLEVRDPSGTLVASDSTSILHTAATSGDYEVRVYANAGLGEYFLEQWFNQAPTANSDVTSTDEDTLINIDVVGNDSDADGDTIGVVSVGNPSNGIAVLKSDGTVDYTPFDDFYGSDSFVYVLEDEHGASTEGVVPVTVTPVNDAPADIQLSANLVNENTATTGGLVIADLIGYDIDSTGLTFDFIAGDGDDDNNLFEIDGDSLKLKSGVEIDYETKPQYSIRVEVSDGELAFDKSLTIDVVDLLEMDALVFDSGSGQMSSIREISVSFPELVTIDSDAFSFTHRGSGNNVGYNMSQSDASGKTVVTFSFAGAGVTHGSLDDGNYQMSIDGGKVQSNASGAFLDGDSDGTGGGTLTFGDQESDGFFRLFGDSDGDRDVDNVDLVRFLNTYRESSESSDYNESMDFDLDGDVDNVDLANYLQRYYTTLPFG